MGRSDVFMVLLGVCPLQQNFSQRCVPVSPCDNAIVSLLWKGQRRASYISSIDTAVCICCRGRSGAMLSPDSTLASFNQTVVCYYSYRCHHRLQLSRYLSHWLRVFCSDSEVEGDSIWSTVLFNFVTCVVGLL